jgi:hypothetical protein
MLWRHNVFPVGYELNFYAPYGINSVFEGLRRNNPNTNKRKTTVKIVHAHKNQVHPFTYYR